VRLRAAQRPCSACHRMGQRGAAVRARSRGLSGAIALACLSLRQKRCCVKPRHRSCPPFSSRYHHPTRTNIHGVNAVAELKEVGNGCGIRQAASEPSTATVSWPNCRQETVAVYGERPLDLPAGREPRGSVQGPFLTALPEPALFKSS